MNNSARLRWRWPAWVPGLLVAGSLLARLEASGATPLFTCPYGGGGYSSVGGFYMPSYPGLSLDSATLQLFTFNPGTFQLALTVRSNAYDGPILGTSSLTIVLSGSVSPATFAFPSVRISKGSRVCFIVSVVSGPASFVYVGTGTCPEVIETQDTTPPLSTARPYGKALVLTGAPSLQVSNGWSIQAAINAAQPGDTVTVAPGTYDENLGLRSGVNVVGAGFNNTLLRGTVSNDVVVAIGVTNSRLEGFKITRAGTLSTSSGIYVLGGNLMVNNNWVIGNSNGIWIAGGSSAIVRNNVVEGNGYPIGPTEGYGIVCHASTPLIANNLILSNRNIGLSFIWTASSGAQALNNTMVGNNTYGIGCANGASPALKNNIVANNQVGISSHGAGTMPALSYNDVWGNVLEDLEAGTGGVTAPGPGDLTADPRFDPTSFSRFALLPGSPCLNAGDPSPLYNDADGSRNDQGAYGGPSALLPGLAVSLNTGFLFTMVGRIPCAFIANSGTPAGLANVPASMASSLGIYTWQDAPFGGSPWIYGLFGASDNSVQYYQILAAKWVGETRPDLTNFVPLRDPLSKIKYTISTNGTVVATLVTVGPDLGTGLYLRTDRADSGYWASPDLKLTLNTRALDNGRYDFICKAFTANSLASEISLLSNSLSRITLRIDNNPVTATIVAVRDPSGATITDCGIVHLVSTNDDLKFVLTASHPTGFLHSYSLTSSFGRNHPGGTIAAERYAGQHDSSPPNWGGVTAFQTNSLPAFLAGSLLPWQTCAYQFHLEAYARTTDGVNFVYGASFDDHYYLTVGPTLVGGCPGDLNGDGRVDGVDLALFALRYGSTNCAAPAAQAAAPAAKP